MLHYLLQELQQLLLLEVPASQLNGLETTTQEDLFD